MKAGLLVLTLVCVPLLAFGQGAVAQDNAALLARMKAMEDRIQTLEAELQQLKSGQASAPPAVAAPAPAQVATAAPEAGTLGGGAASASKVFNPDISVIGDFLGAAGNPGPRPTSALEMHESEVGLQAILDPYARADFFISFSEHGVDLEEGYITFPTLPGHFNLRVGKMRAAFGKVNSLHNHVLPWTDRPLVNNNLVGGEDGINDAGLSLSRIFAGPGGLFLEGTAQVFRGDSEGVFQSYHRSDLSTVGHLRAYKDLSESTNIDIGGSFARGHSTTDPFPTSPPPPYSYPYLTSLINQLYGVDATFRWKPLQRAIYHSFLARTELIWDHNDANLSKKTPFGFYVSGDYQAARRWFVGGRYDRSERSTNALAQDSGGSLILTYWPSEFSQIRGQLRRTSYAEGFTANEILFQFQFSIGAHGAHPF